jgi:glutaredoxin 3
MSRVKIYSTASCPICDKAKNLLSKWNIPYDEYRIDENSEALKEMFTVTNGARTVPQITIDGKWVGGFSELTELHMDGELDDLITQ